MLPIRLEPDGVAIPDCPALAVEQYGQRAGKNRDELLRSGGMGFGIKTGFRIQLNGVHLEPPGIVEGEYGVVPVFPVCFNKRRYGGALDDFNIRVLINGLYRQGRDYDSETNAEINALLFRLVDISDTIKANRKKRIAFEPEEARLIRHCLMEWRNREIQDERQGAVDGINELLILFTR